MSVPAALPRPVLDLSEADLERLTSLFERGTPAATRRAYERDGAYIAAWKAAAFGEALSWPESEAVALRFILDHSEDLTDAPDDHPGRVVAELLIGAGFRRALACPAPASLDRRLATWRSFHRLRGVISPFEAPFIREARKKARRAAARPRKRLSAHPVTREVLDKVLAATGRDDRRAFRDRAILLFAFASGGRRLSEIASLRFGDLSLTRFEAEGIIDIQLRTTKTTKDGETPALLLRGRAATAMKDWLRIGRIGSGPVFRTIAKNDAVLARGLSPEGVRLAFKARLTAAGYPADYASPHGLRSGFLTEAAKRGLPLQSAMRLSLHKSIQQAAEYYDEAELSGNPATDIGG